MVTVLLVSLVRGVDCKGALHSSCFPSLPPSSFACICPQVWLEPEVLQAKLQELQAALDDCKARFYGAKTPADKKVLRCAGLCRAARADAWVEGHEGPLFKG